MSTISTLEINGFFDTVSYSLPERRIYPSQARSGAPMTYKKLKIGSALPGASFESIAHIFRTPTRWLSSDLCNKTRERHIRVDIQENGNAISTSGDVELNKNIILKVIRIAIGLLLVIPCEILGSLFMACTYTDPVIRERRSKGNFVIETIFMQNAQSITPKYVENSDWGTIGVVFEKNKEKKFVINKKTGEIFNNDPKWLIMYKAAGLLLATPYVAVIRTVSTTVMAALNIAFIIPAKVLEGRISLKNAGKEIFLSLFEIFRTVLYTLALEFSALYMIVSPYNGRALYGKMERKLNHQEAGIHSNKFYIPCMQHIGVYNEKDKDSSIPNEQNRYIETIDRLSKF